MANILGSYKIIHQNTQYLTTRVVVYIILSTVTPKPKPKPKPKVKKLGSERFGREIHKLRAEHDLSLRELSEKVGYQFAYIHKIENGVVPPSEDFVYAVSKVFEKDPNAFFLYAGKLTKELKSVMSKHPHAFADLIRELKNAPENVVFRVTQVTREVRDGEW